MLRGSGRNPITKESEEMYDFLRSLYLQSVQEFNQQIEASLIAPGADDGSLLIDSSLKNAILQVRDLAEPAVVDTSRFAVVSAEKILTVSRTGDIIRSFLIPSSEIGLVPNGELACRRKFELHFLRHQADAVWVVNGVPLDENDLKTLVLSTIDAVGKGITPDKMHLRIAETSLTSAVQSLLQERYRLSEALINQQERIFSSVARDIHDGVIGHLMILMRELDSSENNAKLLHSLGTIVEELRNITGDLSSRDIRDWGLEAAVRELAARYQLRSGKVTFRVSFDSKLIDPPHAVSLQIYRIVQEAMNNALKHSVCKNVNVVIEKRDSQLFVTVEDDGKGIEWVSTSNRRGSGLFIMRERAELISANGLPSSLAIRSSPGSGCVVELATELPQD